MFSKAIGTVAAAAVHGVGYILMFDGVVPFLSSFSLFNHSIFHNHFQRNTGIVVSMIYLLIVLCAIVLLGPMLLKYSDFRYLSGEKNE